MKKTILAIALALPVLANTTLAHAEYIMHIAMETPQGGLCLKALLALVIPLLSLHQSLNHLYLTQ